MHENNCRAAGIIVFKKSSKGVKLLGLKALKRFQLMSNGIYDVPKGQIDTGESPFDCAKRECFEETFLKPDIISGPFCSGGLWFWLGETDQEPILGVNPHTGQHEHLDYEWMEAETLLAECLDYLRPSVRWAKEELCRLHL